jgi:hypothetical protein
MFFVVVWCLEDHPLATTPQQSKRVLSRHQEMTHPKYNDVVRENV